MNKKRNLNIKAKELVTGRKAKIAGSAVAVVASLSLIVGGLFSSPADLMQEPKDISLPPPVIDVFIPDPGDDIDPGSDDDTYSDEEKKRGGLKDSIRNRILRIPAAIRACVGIPFWALGWALITGLTALWGTLLSPMFSTILGWICTAAMILLVVCIMIKCAHPEIPIKDIAKKVFSRKPVFITVLSVAVLAGLDIMLPELWNGYEKCKDILKFLASSAVLGVVSGPLIGDLRRFPQIKTEVENIC